MGVDSGWYGVERDCAGRGQRKRLSARGGREKPIMHIREGMGGQVAGVPLTRVCGR
jgi:hypothetical protein